MTKARDLASSGVTLTSTTTTADAALARAGGTMTGNLAMGTNLVDGVDVSARDAVLTDTTTKATAALPKAGGAMTGAITTNSTFDGVDIATRDGILSSTTTTATAALNNANSALSREGGAMTGAITTNSTFDGVDVGARNSVLTSTTTTANAALPKAGGAMTGAITTNSTFDGRDVAADGVLATNALPKAGGTVTGDVTFNTQIGLGAAPHATAPLNITTTNQHIRLNNGSELGVVSLLSSGELELWGHGANESINFRTGAGVGDIAMNIVGTKVGIGIATPAQNLAVKVGSDIIVGVWGDNSAGYGAIQSANVANNAYKQLRFDASSYHFAQGSVGIGTTSITDASWGSGNKELAMDGTTGYSVIHLRGTGAGSTDTRFSHGVGDTKYFMAYDDVASQHRIVVDSAGKIGFGISTPSAGLHLQAADGSENATIMMTSTGVASAGMACDANGLNFGADTGGFVFKTGAQAADPTDSGTQRMSIDSSGKIKIGNDIPMWSGQYGGAVFLKGNNSTAARHFRASIVDSNGAQAGNFHLTLGNNGDVTIGDGNLVVASGHGIDFSATSDGSGTDTSELLNDYEVGTWTPTFINCTTTNQNTIGHYMKIGQRVFFNYYTGAMIISSASTSVEARIGGLPYPSSAATQNYSPFSISHINTCVEANTNSGFITKGGDTMYLMVGGLVQYSKWQNGSGRYIMISGNYMTG